MGIYTSTHLYMHAVVYIKCVADAYRTYLSTNIEDPLQLPIPVRGGTTGNVYDLVSPPQADGLNMICQHAFIHAKHTDTPKRY